MKQWLVGLGGLFEELKEASLTPWSWAATGERVIKSILFLCILCLVGLVGLGIGSVLRKLDPPKKLVAEGADIKAYISPPSYRSGDEADLKVVLFPHGAKRSAVSSLRFGSPGDGSADGDWLIDTGELFDEPPWEAWWDGVSTTSSGESTLERSFTVPASAGSYLLEVEYEYATTGDGAHYSNQHDDEELWIELRPQR